MQLQASVTKLKRDLAKMNAFRKAILDSFADDQDVSSASGIDISSRAAMQDVVDTHV